MDALLCTLAAIPMEKLGLMVSGLNIEGSQQELCANLHVRTLTLAGFANFLYLRGLQWCPAQSGLNSQFD